MDLILPWPPATLSPNRSLHWARLMKEKSRYREACRLVTLASKQRAPEGPLHLQVDFRPPNRRSYDRDNLVARMKAGWDGMSDGLGINDKRFTVLTVRVGGSVPGGEVRLRITPDVGMQIHERE